MHVTIVNPYDLMRRDRCGTDPFEPGDQLEVLSRFSERLSLGTRRWVRLRSADGREYLVSDPKLLDAVTPRPG